MSEKLQKILARAGVASRRAAEELIKANKVTVNGKAAKLGDRATAADAIAVHGKIIDTDTPEQIVMLYHKPEGYICSRFDEQGRPLIFQQLPDCPAGRWLYVGRLDINSSGLLLITNDGSLANKLTHPSKHVPRTYLVRVIGNVDTVAQNKLRNGIKLEDGMARFTKIKQSKKSGSGKNRWYEVTVTEGRNRIVRRMFEAVNCTVNRLVRIKFGNLSLPRDLQPGHSRILDKKELNLLQD